MLRPQKTDAGSSTSGVKKRGYEGSDGDKPAKKQKQPTKHEQQEQSLRELATALGTALAELKATRAIYSLEDKLTSDIIRGLSALCEEVKRHELLLDATSLPVLRYSVPLLEENELSKLDDCE
jgi:hypothetical protein